MAFLTYVLRTLLMGKRHGGLLGLAALALGLSAFALLVLQSTMGGLQRGVEDRSKYYKGDMTLFFDLTPEDEVLALVEKLNLKGMKALPLLEFEVLIKQAGYTSAARIWGVSSKYALPHIKNLNATYLGADLSFQIKSLPGANLEFIFPTFTDPLLGEVPRQMEIEHEQSFSTQLMDIDSSLAIVPDKKVQNLIRFRGYNRIKVFGKYDQKILEKLFKEANFSAPYMRSWEKENQTLVWALRLESTVMIFLFASMTLLVTLAIISGLLLFFSKLKRDLIAFWIMGMSMERLVREMSRISQVLCLVPIFFGLGFGSLCLVALDLWGGEIMPAVFVERKIPVSFHWSYYLISFLIPYAISSSAVSLALKSLGLKQAQFVQSLRGLN